jgi:hypothetical protein
MLIPWYKRWRATHKRMDYADKLYGSQLPASHLKRPTRRQIMAAAKRFAKDGEIRNAVEMMRLAYYPEQLKIYFR